MAATNSPAADDPILPRPRRRLRLPLTLIVLVAGWYGGQAAVRHYVNSLMQGKVGAVLQPFSLRDRAGETWSPERLRGRPAVLHFFRSRCESCDQEAADYRQLEATLPADRATILHFVMDDVMDIPAAETEATIAHKSFARPILLADKPFVAAFHGVAWSKVTPVTYVVDAGGAIRAALRGKQTKDAIEAALASID